jgi:hypothetical protein
MIDPLEKVGARFLAHSFSEFPRRRIEREKAIEEAAD